MYKFVIKSAMYQFSDYIQRDMDSQETGQGEIHQKEFSWPETGGGLVLGVEAMSVETYYAAPIKREKIKQNEASRINKIKISLGDTDFNNSRQFIGDIDLIKGAKVIIRRTTRQLDHTDPASYKIVFRGYVTSVAASQGNIQFEVSERYHDWSRPLNKREFSKVCNFVFKGTRCGYVGQETFCDKTLPACQGYGNETNFGGFPELPSLQFKGF